MADNEITEDIVLELKTNFEAELRKAATQYSSFQKSAGSISRSLETNVNTMFRSVTSNINSMLGNVQQTVTSSINMTRGAMRTTQVESIKLSKTYEAYVNRMLDLRKKAESIASSQIMKPTGKQAALEGLSQVAIEESAKASQDMYSQLGSIANNASKTILKSTADTLNSIKELAKGTKSTLVELQVAINNSKDAGSVSAAKSKIDEIEAQMKQARKTVQDQAKQVVAAETEMNNARIALMNQTDAKLMASQEQYFKQTVQNVVKTQKAYHETEKAVARLEKTFLQGKERISQASQGAGEKIRLQIDMRDVETHFKAIMENFKNSVHLAGNGLSAEFSKSIQNGEILKRVLNDDKKALEEMLAKAKELHATGLVDASKEIEAIQTILGRMSEFKAEFKELQKLADFFDFAKWQGKLKAAEEALSSLQAKITNTLKMPPQLNADSNIYDLQKAKENLTTIEGLEKSFAAERKKIIKDIETLEKDSQKTQLQLVKETNKEKIQQLNQNLAILQEKANQLRNVLSASIAPDTSKLKSDIENTATRLRKSISDSLSRLSKEPEEVFNNINKMYAAMNDKYNKLSNKKFIGKNVVTEFKSSMQTITQAVDKYNAEIVSLKENIEKLQKLQKLGLAPNATVELEQLRKQLTEMKAHTNELSNIRNSAIKKSEALTKQASKGMFSHGLDAIRNFRWQVAGFIYLVTKAVNMVKNTFFKVIQDIQTFRTSALSIAASISYSLLGNMSENFNQAFIYSKELMNKLEMEAAKTILTLEDMTMLTKTFAQAGIIPKTDEDIRKISTIGTAIKILTEGMANAGVQMRQELYALIQGRQRAVDQVATMFSMIGINIQEMLDKGKKEGKSMIDVLSEALKPFEEVNKAMARDFSVQSEALSKIWDKIKRIGGDNTYWEMSETIENINNGLATMNGEMVELTEKGRGLAAIIAMIMESVRLTIKSLGVMVSGMYAASTASEGLLAIFKVIARTVALISITIDAVATTINILLSWVTGIVATAITFLTDGPKMAMKVWKEVDKSLVEMWNKFDERAGDLAIDVENSIKSIDKILQGTKEGAAGLGDSFKLPHNVLDEFSKIGDAVQKAKLASLSGIAKINEEYEQDIIKHKELKEQVLENIRAIQVVLTQPIGVDQRKEFDEKLKGHKKALDDISAIESHALVERNRKVNEHYEKERQQIISLKSEFDSLMESMNVAPKSKMEAIEKKYRKEEIKLKKWLEKNANELPNLLEQHKEDFAEMGITTSQELTDALRKAFNKGKDDSIAETTKEIQDDFDAMMETLKSRDVLNPLAKITNEMNKQRNIILDNNNYTEEQVRILLQAVDAHEKDRKALERIAILQKASEVKAETDESFAAMLDLSIRTMDKQKAELIRLEKQYELSTTSIKGKIEAITEIWKENGEWVNEAPDEIKNMVVNYETQLDNLESVLNYHKDMVQKPFWNDLKEMSQGWFDSFADVITNAMEDMDSFNDAFHELVRSIAKDVTKAWVKRNVTDNLMNMLPSFGPKEEKGTEEEKAKKELVDTMKGGWDKVTEMFKEGFDGFVDITEKGFTMLKDGLGSLLTSIMNMFSSSNSMSSFSGGLGGWGSIIGSVGGMIAGAFSGGLGGGAAAGATQLSTGAIHNTSGVVFGMANGGVIKEPIIGKGLRSGASYQFGEGGIHEAVIPMSDMKKMGSGGNNTLSISIPVSVTGGISDKFVSKLKQELERTVETTTMRIMRESI